VGFGLYLMLKLNAALVWATPSTWFSTATALVALTNIWFGFRLLWHAGHELGRCQSGGAAPEQQLMLIRLAKYYPLFLVFLIEAVFCGFYANLFAEAYARNWSSSIRAWAWCLAEHAGARRPDVMAGPREARIIYLPPLLLAGVMIVLALNAREFRRARSWSCWAWAWWAVRRCSSW